MTRSTCGSIPWSRLGGRRDAGRPRRVGPAGRNLWCRTGRARCHDPPLWLLARSATSLQGAVAGDRRWPPWRAHRAGPPGPGSAGWSGRGRGRRRGSIPALWRQCTERPDDAVRVVGRPVPEGLAEDPLPPGILFTRGPLGALALPAVAIIGTAIATVGGMETAAALGKEILRGRHRGGLGPPRSTAAHRGALSAGRGPPIAVVSDEPTCLALQRRPVGRGRASWPPVRRGATRHAAGTHRFPPATASLPHSPTWSSWSSRGSAVAPAHRAEAGVRSVPVMAVPGSVRSPASRARTSSWSTERRRSWARSM